MIVLTTLNLDPSASAAGSGSAAGFLAAALPLLGAALLSGVLLSWRRRDRARHGPPFRDFARQLRLDRRQCRLLLRIARAGGVQHAGSLLVSRGAFDRAASRFAGGPANAHVDQLRRYVFG